MNALTSSCNHIHHLVLIISSILLMSADLFSSSLVFRLFSIRFRMPSPSKRSNSELTIKSSTAFGKEVLQKYFLGTLHSCLPILQVLLHKQHSSRNTELILITGTWVVHKYLIIYNSNEAYVEKSTRWQCKVFFSLPAHRISFGAVSG